MRMISVKMEYLVHVLAHSFKDRSLMMMVVFMFVFMVIYSVAVMTYRSRGVTTSAGAVLRQIGGFLFLLSSGNNRDKDLGQSA